MIRRLALASLLFCLGACVSPTDPLGRGDALEEAQQKYMDLVRWGELDKAGMYVDPAMREEYMRLAPAFEALRITDFEVGDIDRDADNANVMVTYRGYVPSQLIERAAREQQAWYRDGLGNTWLVRPQLASVVSTLYGRAPAGPGH